MFSYSDTELKILSNFSKINPQIKIESNKFAIVNGNRKSVVGLYEVETDKDHQPYSVYDLAQFLEVIRNCGPNVGLEVNEKSVTVYNRDLGSKLNYQLVDEEYVPVVKSPTEKFKKIDPELVFHLSNDKLQSLKKMSSLCNLERVFFQDIDGDLVVTCGEVDLFTTRNPYTLKLSKAEVEKCVLKDTILTLKMDELLVLEGDYDVKITEKGISEWVNKQYSVVYYIGVAKV